MSARLVRVGTMSVCHRKRRRDRTEEERKLVVVMGG